MFVYVNGFLQKQEKPLAVPISGPADGE